MFKAEEPQGPRRIGTNLAEINIIPLVDVVLVLLLIFMLTAPMMYRGIDVNLPKAASKPTAVEERMVLTVTKDQSLFLNEKRVAPTGLELTLRQAFANRNDKTLYLKADSALSYGAVVETMDRVRRAAIGSPKGVPMPPRVEEPPAPQPAPPAPAELPRREASRDLPSRDLPSRDLPSRDLPPARDAGALPDRTLPARATARLRPAEKELPTLPNTQPTPAPTTTPPSAPARREASAAPPPPQPLGAATGSASGAGPLTLRVPD